MTAISSVGIEVRTRDSLKRNHKTSTSRPLPGQIAWCYSRANMAAVFVCDISALSSSDRVKYLSLVQELNRSRTDVQEIDSGYSFCFDLSSESIMKIAEFITYERLYCPFFDFETLVMNQLNQLWLTLRGDEGVKEFIRYEFDIQ